MLKLRQYQSVPQNEMQNPSQPTSSMTIYCIQPPEVIMKALPWIVASLGVGVALCVLWEKRSRQFQTIGGGDLHDAIEDVAETTFGWGTKQRVAG